MKKTSLLLLLFVFCFVVQSQVTEDVRLHSHKASTKVLLANKGVAKFPIVISVNTSENVKLVAQTLGEYLTKISGAKFALNTGNGMTGIAVGLMGDFPDIPITLNLDPFHPRQHQGYEIKSHSNGVYIIGVTPKAVEYAVFDFLYQLGYRQYFPMKKWEIIPQKKKLEFGLHIKELPDYYSRNIWPGYRVWPEFSKDSIHWNAVNRNIGYALRTRHVYMDIIRLHKSEFDKHPEYYPLIDGKRKTEGRDIKFCISNPGLRSLVVNYALKQFQQNPSLESTSMDPSDGGGWCECEHCLKIGTPSTRAVFLANTVAQAVREKFQGKKIGMYAYNMHSPPPEIEVDQDVVVSVATSFISGGLTLDELINGWKAKKAVLGIREYYDVYIWSKMLPGKSKGSNFDYLQRTIPEFYNQGVRYISSEASDDWIPSGLGYYVATRMLWNIDSDVSAIIDDFVNNAFGPAAQTIKEFYTLLDGSEPKVLVSDPIGRMYRLLAKARAEARAHESVLDRITDLTLYTRYAELYKNFETSPTVVDKQRCFDELMSFIASIKDYRIIHTYAIDKGVHWERLSPNRNLYQKPEWNSVAYSSVAIDNIIKEGVANNELMDFQPIGFGTELVLSKSFSKTNKPSGKLFPRRGDRRYYTWVGESLEPINILVTGGLSIHLRNRGNVKVSLSKLGGASDDGSYETIIQTDTTTIPNGVENMVTLNPKQAGLHAVDLFDGNGMTNDVWINYDKTFQADKALRGTFYFYVPKGTKKIGLYYDLSRGKLCDPDDKEVYIFKNTSDFQSFPVKDGQDGKIWSFKNVSGIIKLMTVPSYFSLNPKYLLLPKEVVIKDSL